MLGTHTGFRVSELLKLTVADVVLEGDVRQEVTLGKSRMKGKYAARSVILSDEAQACLRELLADLEQRKRLTPKTPLFIGQHAKAAPITRRQAHRIIRQGARATGIKGKIATHSLRKTFARSVHLDLLARQAVGERIDPLILVSKALGHRKISTTLDYLPVNQQAVDEAILSIGKKYTVNVSSGEDVKPTQPLKQKKQHKTKRITR